MTDPQSMQTLWMKAKELLTLKYEYARLTFAEKLIMILAMVALGFVALLVFMMAVFFLSLALANWMAGAIGMGWSALIVAGIYLVLLVLMVLLRKQIFINPVSRFITRLFA